jgi:sulfate-transporting ATPase
MSSLFQFALLGLGSGGVYAVAGLGMTQIFRVSGVVNLAHGAIAYFAATLFVSGWRVWQWPALVAGGVAVATSAALGAAIHLTVMRPLRSAPVVTKLVATLGLFAVLQQGVPLWLDQAASTPIGSFYPQGRWELASGVGVAYDRLIVLGTAITIALALGRTMSTTRFGLATTAVATDPMVAATMAVPVERVAFAGWMLGAGLAGLAGVLIVPIAGTLAPLPLLLLVVPALVASLLGEFRSYALTVAGGIGLGVAQSLLVRYQSSILPDHLAVGWPDAVPFLVLIVLLAVRASTIPGRDSEAIGELPAVGRYRPQPLLVLAVAVLAATVTWNLSPRLAVAVTTTAVMVIIGLSLVVVTGLAGQISLAQVTFAGIGALAAARVSADLSWPFPVAFLVGVAVGSAAGAVVGLAAVRTRGPTLAVATVGLGLAVEQVVFSNAWFTGGGFSGTVIERPSLFGVDVSAVDHPNRYAALCAAVLVAIGGFVGSLRSGRFGRRMLAVRTNERAAAAIGVSVAAAKLQAFAIANAIAAVGGVLLAFRFDSVQFSSFGVLGSFELVVLTVIGGVGFIVGPIVGVLAGPSGVLTWLGDTSATTTRWVGVLSGVLVLVVLVGARSGVVGSVAGLVGVPPRRRSEWSKLDDAHLAELGTQQAMAGAQGVAGADGAAGGASTMPPLVVSGLGVTLGQLRIVNGFDVRIEPGEVVGLIGPNGAGKTTVIDAITGFIAHHGCVMLGDDDLTAQPPHRRCAAGLARTFQTIEPFADLSIAENLLVAAESTAQSPRPRMASGRVAAAAAAIGLDHLDRTPEQLAQGERRLVGLARALAGSPRYLLLDEPAAGLDSAATEQLGSLIQRLARQRGIGVLLVDHDIDLVVAACDRIVALDCGTVIAAGNAADVVSDPAVRRAYLGDPDSDPAVENGSSPNGDRVVAARHRRGRRTQESTDARVRTVRYEPALTVRDLGVRYGDTVAVHGVSIDVHPGELVAVLGRNGAGKTSTLLGVAGAVSASGVVQLRGTSLPAGLARRSAAGLALLPERRSVIGTLTPRDHLRLVGVDEHEAVALVPELAQLMRRRAALLSGGEQQLLAVTCCLARRPSVVLVDELSFGLAPVVVHRLLHRLRQAADDGAAIVVVEQYPRAVLAVADRGYVLHGGEVVLDGSAADLLDRVEDIEATYFGRSSVTNQ